jgi:hypothetical protein
MERIWSPRSKPDDSKRKYLNWPTAAEDAWVEPESGRARWRADAEHHPPAPRSCMFFDGSKSRDATALIGCDVDSGHVFTLGVWEPDPNDDEDTVDAPTSTAVIRTFERYDVLAFFGDVKEWESFVLTEWPSRYKDDLLVWAVPNGKPPQPIAWDMRSHKAEFARRPRRATRRSSRRASPTTATRASRVTSQRPPAAVPGMGVDRQGVAGLARKIDAAVCVIGAGWCAGSCSRAASAARSAPARPCSSERRWSSAAHT